MMNQDIGNFFSICNSEKNIPLERPQGWEVPKCDDKLIM